MTIREAIERTDALKFNTYSRADKIMWLNALDWTVKREIMDQHEGNGAADFQGYHVRSDENTQLLVPPPYDQVYLRWLEAQIDYHNGEYDRYNASIILFNNAFGAFAGYYKRMHMPVSTGTRFLF